MHIRKISNALKTFNNEGIKNFIPNRAVDNKLSQLDKDALYSYIGAKPYIMGLSDSDVAMLDKYEGKDFVSKSFSFITKHLGYGKDVSPILCFAKLNGAREISYNNFLNIIFADIEKFMKCPKNVQFSYVRHAIQLFVQNAQILRHEDLGNKAFDIYVSKYKSLKKELAVQYKPEELKQFGIMIPDNKYISGLSKLKSDLIKQFGVIKRDSAQSGKVEDYFNEICVAKYNKSDSGMERLKKFITSKSLTDAVFAQTAADFDYLKEGCYIKYFKNVMNELSKNGAADEILAKLRVE